MEMKTVIRRFAHRPDRFLVYWKHEWEKVKFTVRLPRMTISALEEMAMDRNMFRGELLDDLIWRAHEYHEAGERLPTYEKK